MFPEKGFRLPPPGSDVRRVYVWGWVMNGVYKACCLSERGSGTFDQKSVSEMAWHLLLVSLALFITLTGKTSL